MLVAEGSTHSVVIDESSLQPLMFIANYLINSGEGFGQVEMDRRVGDGELSGIGLMQPCSVEGEGGAPQRVDEPDVLDAHAEIIGEGIKFFLR